MKTLCSFLFLGLALPFSLAAQEARIMIVERSDSKALAESYKAYKDAKKRWEDEKAAVAKKYTVENGKTIEGWDKVQFSADFRALVPDTSQYAAHSPCYSWYNIPNTNVLMPSNGTASAGNALATGAFFNSTGESVKSVDDIADLKVIEPKIKQ